MIKDATETEKVIAAQAADAVLAIRIDDDQTQEESSTITVTLGPPTTSGNYNIACPDSASVAVRNDDFYDEVLPLQSDDSAASSSTETPVGVCRPDGPTVTIADGTAVTEGATARFTLTRTEPPSHPLSDPLTVSVAVEQTSISVEPTPGDMLGTAPSSVTFGPGSKTATLEVPTISDTVHESNVRLSAGIAAATSDGDAYLVGGRAWGTAIVRDDDAPRPRPTPPAAPTGVVASSATANSLTVTWNTVNGVTYKVRKSTTDLTGRGPESAGSHRFTGLTPSSSYTLGVQAHRGGLSSNWVNAKALSTLASPSVKASVSRASCVIGGEVTVSWTTAGGKAPLTVSVTGPAPPTSTTVSSQTFACKTAGEQQATVRVTDSSATPVSASATVSWTVIDQKPAPVVTIEEVGRTTVASEWRLYADDIPGALPPNPPGSCYWEYWQQDRYALAEFETDWKWDSASGKWVLDPTTKIQIGAETDYIYEWYFTGYRLDCGLTAGAGTPPAPPTGALPAAPRRTCAESPPRADGGALSLDLDAQWCSIVRAGGELTARYGEWQVSLDLPSDRNWLVLAASQSESTEVVGLWIIDWQSKSHLILDPTTGVELSRRLAEGAGGLAVVLDAVAGSAKADE